MSKKESKKRLKRRSKSYRLAMMITNIVFVILIIFIGIYGALHTFTKKKEYRNKGVDEYKAGQYEKAIEFFDKALAEKQWFSDKLDADILLFKADSYIKLKQYDDSSRIYAELKKYPEYIKDDIDLELLIKVNNSFILFDKGDYTASVDGFVAGYNGDYDSLSLYAGICYENLKDYDKMHLYYGYYKTIHGNDSFLSYKEATYYMNLESDMPSNTDNDFTNYDKALSAINVGLELDDGQYDKELRFAQIVCHEKKNELETAFEEAKEYIGFYPEDVEGKKLYDYLESRVEPDTELVNPIFGDDNSTSSDMDYISTDDTATSTDATSDY